MGLREKFIKFNERLAGRLADSLATIAMFYGISILTLSILFFQAPTSALGWVQYIVQTFFQGVALPVLAFVAKMEGQKNGKLLKETHDTVMSEMKEIKELVRGIKEIDKEIDNL